MQYPQQVASPSQDLASSSFPAQGRQMIREHKPAHRAGGESHHKREDAADEVEIRLCIHQKSCGPVIGKNGAVIREIQTDCGVAMKLDDKNEIISQSPDRALTISGKVEAVEKAVELIIPKLAVEFEIAKEPHFDANIVIPTEAVGSLIGKDGISIRAIADETGTKIRVTNDIDAIPQSATRLVRIAGAPEAVEKAKAVILGNVENSAMLEDYTDNIDMRMLIPHGAVGLVIGKGGSKIKEIANSSECKIQLSNEKDIVSGLNVRAIDLSGSCKNVIRARDTIDAIVKKGIEEGTVDSKIIVLKLALSSNLIGFIIGKNGENIKNINKQTRAHVKIIQKEKNPNVYECPVIITGQPEWVIKALGMLCQKLLSTPELPKAQHAQHRNYNYSNNFKKGSHDDSASSTAGNKGKQEGFSGSSSTTTTQVNYRVLSGSAESQDISIAVPISVTGKVIGRGGNIIRFIVNSSQARIKIQQKEDLPPNPTEREINLSGETENINKALDYITQFMNNSPEYINSVIKSNSVAANMANQPPFNTHLFNNLAYANQQYYNSYYASGYPPSYPYSMPVLSNNFLPPTVSTVPAVQNVPLPNGGTYTNQENSEMTIESNNNSTTASTESTPSQPASYLYNNYTPSVFPAAGTTQFSSFSYSQ